MAKATNRPTDSQFLVSGMVIKIDQYNRVRVPLHEVQLNMQFDCVACLVRVAVSNLLLLPLV
jgi:hypothetical protein